jgi:hypothetical protein
MKQQKAEAQKKGTLELSGTHSQLLPTQHRRDFLAPPSPLLWGLRGNTVDTIQLDSAKHNGYRR